MTIDFWGLGLQAVNVLILIWLLARVFWRPVAAAIVARQEASSALLDQAKAAQTEADAANAKAKAALDGVAEERAALLDVARAEAEKATKAAIAATKARTEEMLAAAKEAIAHDRSAASKCNAEQAAKLSMDIAAKLLGRLNGPAVQSAFLDLLVEAIAKLPEQERAAIADSPDGIEIIVASEDADDQKAITAAVHKAMGGKPAVRFVTDAALIAGIELRTAHFALHNSWQADLARIEKAVHDAA